MPKNIEVLRVEREVKRGYMCKTDFDCELESALGGNVVYPSIEDLRECRGCIDECGIVEVEVYLARVVQPRSVKA